MRCTICQRFLPKTARKGTRFCGTNCRSRAYRLRQQQADASPHRPSIGKGGAQGQPKATRTRRRAHMPVTIPAVLAHLQQVRERVGLPPLRTDPMLAYQASLDALLAQHMVTRRILLTQVTGAGQAARGNTAWLQDPSATQVGIGVSLTERGDSVVVILLGRQITEALAPVVGGVRTPASSVPPAPRAAAQQASLQPHATATAHGESLRVLKPNMKIKTWPGFSPEDQPTPAQPSDGSETVATAATPPADKVKPET